MGLGERDYGGFGSRLITTAVHLRYECNLRPMRSQTAVLNSWLDSKFRIQDDIVARTSHTMEKAIKAGHGKSVGTPTDLEKLAINSALTGGVLLLVFFGQHRLRRRQTGGGNAER